MSASGPSSEPSKARFWGIEPAKLGARLVARREPLAISVAVAAGLVGIAGANLPGTLAVLLLAVLWAAAWPEAMPASEEPHTPFSDAPPPPPEASATAGLLQVALETMDDAALLMDDGLRVVVANPAARALLHTLPGRHISLSSRDPHLLAAIEAATRSGTIQPFTLRVDVPIERQLNGKASLLPGSAGVLVVLRDRTEEQQLAQMRADFVANASHELRTPLASLKGFVETLQGAAKDDPAARERFLAIMQGEASRMARLIDDLLSLSRVEMREHVAPTGQVDLAELIAQTASLLRPQADAAGIALHLPPQTPAVVVVGERDELVQVLQNLIQNAIKYGRRGGRVDVTLAPQGRHVVVSLADDGIGIAPEHLPRLTERFYRVSAKDSRERGGTGLGLAIVKHIVNRHRGELDIVSQVGRGSTFTLRLPSAAP